MWQSTHAPFWPIHAQTSSSVCSTIPHIDTELLSCQQQQQQLFFFALFLWSLSIELGDATRHQDPLQLLMSLWGPASCAVARKPRSKTIISSPPLAHFPFSRHASTATCVRPDHLPHNAAVSLPSPPSISLHLPALNCEPEQPAKRLASSHLKTSSAFKLKTGFGDSLLLQRFRMFH